MAERVTTYKGIDLSGYAPELREVIVEQVDNDPTYRPPTPSQELNEAAQKHKMLFQTTRLEIMRDRAAIIADGRLSGAQKELLLAQSNGLIDRYTAEELHDLYMADNVEVGHLHGRIAEFDAAFGEAFRTSPVRQHYEELVKVVAYWNYGKARSKGEQPHSEDVLNLPDFNLETGQVRTSLIELVWGLEDIYEEVRPLAIGEQRRPPLRLLDVMTRLDQSSDRFMYIDRTDGAEVIRNDQGKYVKQKDGRWVVVRKESLGYGYQYLRSGKASNPVDAVVVNVTFADGTTRYVKRSRLLRGSIADRSLDRADDWVQAEEIVQPYNYGRLPSEKIYSEYKDPAQIREIEVTAQRLAEAMAEPIDMTEEETATLISKGTGDLMVYRIPNTPKEDKVNRWVTHHGMIGKVRNTAHALSQNIVDSLPATLMHLRQPTGPRTIRLSSGREVTLRVDKKGTWRELWGLSWKELAALQKEDIYELGRSYNMVVGASMPYDRMKQAADVIDEASGIIAKEVWYSPDRAFLSWADGAIGKYSKPWGEKFDLFVRLMREVTPREVKNLQQATDVDSTVTKVLEKVRKFFAWHEFLAWKVSPLFIESKTWVKGYSAEERGRQIFNELFAADEAVIRDEIVGLQGWNDHVIRMNYAGEDVFCGGVVLEQWLKSFKRFQEGGEGLGVVDSQGRRRAILFSEVLQFLGMRYEMGNYRTTDGQVIERRKLRMLANSPEDPAWRAYLADSNHGVDPRVVVSLREFFNAGSSPVVPQKDDALFGQVLPPYFDVGDLFRTKYAAVDWFLENAYPYRMWASDALTNFQAKVNKHGPVNEHGYDDALFGLLSNPFDKGYRWGYLPGREPLELWKAALRMSSETRLEIAPDVRYLEKVTINEQGVKVPDGTANGLVMYRVGNPNYCDPRLLARGIVNVIGFATHESLLEMYRKDALSIETVEYGNGNYVVDESGTGYGMNRPPIDLARRPLHFKVPMESVKHSLQYREEAVRHIVAREMQIDPHTTIPAERQMLDAYVEERWDARTEAIHVAAPTDIFFMYYELLAAKKINPLEFVQLCSMAGCHMELQFDSNGGMHIRRGQGAAFVESMKRLGITDKFLNEMLKKDVEGANEAYKDAVKLLGAYFFGRGTPVITEALDNITKASYSQATAFLRNAVVPGVGVATVSAASYLGSAYFAAMGEISPAIAGAITCTVPLITGVAGAGYAYLQARLISTQDRSTGKVKRDRDGRYKYERSSLQSKTSLRASLNEHRLGRAVWNCVDDSVVTKVDANSGSLYKDLTKLYDQPWAAAHGTVAVGA